MTPSECERIFERIEEYKRSTEKYIQDIAGLVERINEGYILEEDNTLFQDEMMEQEDEQEYEQEYEQEDEQEHEYEHNRQQEHDYEPLEQEDFEMFQFDEDEDLADFLAETFEL